MASIITKEGVDSALNSLNYRNPKSLKFRMVNAVQEIYGTYDSLDEVKSIDDEQLIKRIWGTGDDEKAIRSKRKNFNTVKFSVNADLLKLFDEGKNTEGIELGPRNTYEISREAKDKFLDSFSSTVGSGGEVSLNKIADVLNTINDIISDYDTGESEGKSKVEFEKIGNLISEMTKKMSAGKGFKITPVEEDSSSGKEEGTESDRKGLGEESTEVVEDDTEETGEEAQTGEIDSDVDIEAVDGEAEVEEIEEDEPEIEEVSDEDMEGVDGDSKTGESFKDDLEKVSDGSGLDAFEDLGEFDEDEILEIDDDEELEEIETDVIEDTEDSDNEDTSEEVVKDETEETSEDAETGEINSDVDMEDVAGEAEIEENSKGAIAAGEFDDSEAGESNKDDLGEVSDGSGLDAFEDLGEFDEDEIVEIDDDEELEEIETDEIEDTEDSDNEEGYDDTELEKADDDVETIDEDTEIEEIEDDSELEDISEEAVEADIEEIDDDEKIEEMDELSGEEEFSEAEDSKKEEITGIDDEDIEELDEDTAIEEVDDEDIEDIDEDDELEEFEEVDESPETASPIDQSGLQYDEPDDEFNLEKLASDVEKRKVLAERFDGYLGAMERYYNQYLLVPAGKYTIGVQYPLRDQAKLHEEYLEAFYLGKYPVTNALFEIFIERTGYITTAEEVGSSTVYFGRYQTIIDKNTGRPTSVWNASYSTETIEGACWYQPFGPESNLHKKRAHPVVHISFKDAVAFSAWIGKRLPSENEWESAARTREGFHYPWGNKWKDGCCNIDDSAVSDTTPVDEYKSGSNNLELYDFLGNVLEWTSDEVAEEFEGTVGTPYHIAKGGSWISDKTITLTSRFKFEPDFTSNILGFRCVAF
ncbi:MAG: SUMF1/EgtB/PvdO family nonheme iron enzyme [Desulfobacterales bacterium]|nr:SUMF1/EgtB/PvdO family nonheme iron enzyme [Desulfobacterales bacterium]